MPRKTRRPSTRRSRSPRPGPQGPTSGPRRVKPLDTRMSPSEEDQVFARRFPNMAAQRDLDRALHLRAARKMGATRKQASRHADEEVGRPTSTSSTRLRRGR